MVVAVLVAELEHHPPVVCVADKRHRFRVELVLAVAVRTIPEAVHRNTDKDPRVKTMAAPVELVIATEELLPLMVEVGEQVIQAVLAIPLIVMANLVLVD